MGIIDEALKKSSDEKGNNSDQKKPKTGSDQRPNTYPTHQYKNNLGDTGRANKKSPGIAKSLSVNLDWDYIGSQGFLTQDTERLQLLEEYRTIKRPIMANAFGGRSKGIERANLILVTSSVPGEGKTFSAINLALSFAQEKDHEVLLIDADVAKPSVSEVLGIDNTPGLIEYLESDDMDLSEIIQNTDMDGFRIVPAGNRHSYSTELLASKKMANLATELSQRYSDRIVIFDSPPILAATQGEVLATLVGQVVLVIEAETTPQATVKETVAKLDKCDVVLALLNKTNHGFGFGSYAYGYGYGYGYGSYGHS